MNFQFGQGHEVRRTFCVNFGVLGKGYLGEGKNKLISKGFTKLAFSDLELL